MDGGIRLEWSINPLSILSKYFLTSQNHKLLIVVNPRTSNSEQLQPKSSPLIEEKKKSARTSIVITRLKESPLSSSITKLTIVLSKSWEIVHALPYPSVKYTLLNIPSPSGAFLLWTESYQPCFIHAAQLSLSSFTIYDFSLLTRIEIVKTCKIPSWVFYANIHRLSCLLPLFLPSIHLYALLSKYL